MLELDSFDFAILRIIQKDNYTPQKEIGEQIGLSAAAVQRRIKKMTDSGVISRNVAVIDREQIGKFVTLIVEVIMERDKLIDVEEAKETFRNAPEVQQCYYVTGNADFMLVILVPSMHDYELVTHRLFFNNPNIKNFKTYVCMNLVKTGISLPI